MSYVGLTDDPEKSRADHGYPADFTVVWQFDSETTARAWEKLMLKNPGFQGVPGRKGWKYGYIYTINQTTIQ